MYQSYPRQFWLMFIGMLISTVGGSMIWPFLMIYSTETLGVSMTIAAALMTINSGFGIVASFIAGPVIDRLGRKWIMVISLLVNGIGYLFLSGADSFLQFSVLMILIGVSQPLYRIGGDAMMADLLPPDQRADGYALLRLSNNLGVAIGPALGGFLAATSYTFAFYGAAAGLVIYGILLAAFALETLPKMLVAEEIADNVRGFRRKILPSYSAIIADRPFIRYVTAYTLVIICASLVWVVLPAYAKDNFGLQENVYGFIPTTNAVMVIMLQISTTRITKRFRPLPVSLIGATIYTVAIISVAFGQGFWGFWLSMVIMTFGELILFPTASTYAANLAPPDMRGRYMSIFGLSWRFAIGLGPIFGGLMNDYFSPVTI